MNIETRVYQILTKDIDLTTLLDTIRGEKLDETAIWKYDIPENYRKKEWAPFIRISPIYESDYLYSDDDEMSEEQRVQISFWCEKDSDAYEIKQAIDRALKKYDFTRYTANENPRYKDPDIDLLINHRKYRFYDWQKQKEAI